MAEIRSTLDIIMEKTKNMTMSDEEKAEFKRQTLSGRIKGWVQKHLDNIISLKEITSQISSEREKTPAMLEELLKKELIGRIDPDLDNEKVFQLLIELLDMNIDPLEETIGRFHEKVINEKAAKQEALRQILAERQISGSAIVPNVENDTSWRTFYEDARTAFKNQLFTIAGMETTAAQ